MNLGDFASAPRFDRYGATSLPNGVVRITNLSPNYRGQEDFLYPGGGGRMGRAVWNPGTGGYVDTRTGSQLGNLGQDKASVVRNAMAAMAGAGTGGGPAFYGDSYGGVQSAAAQARARAQNYDLTLQGLAQTAAENATQRDWAASQADIQRKFEAQHPEIYQRRQGFQDGGYTGDGPPDEVAGVVHRGEVVIPAPVVDALRPTVGPGSDGRWWREWPGHDTPEPMDFDAWRRDQVARGLLPATPELQPPAVARITPSVTPPDEVGKGRWVPLLQIRGRNQVTGDPVIVQQGWQGIDRTGKVTATIPLTHPFAAQAAADHAANVREGRTVWNPKTHTFEDGGPAYALKRELGPAVTRQAEIEDADTFHKTKLADLNEERDAGEKSGKWVWNKKTKEYEPGPGPVMTALPDGTPLPPEMIAGHALSRQARNAARIAGLEKDIDRTTTAAKEIQGKLLEADDRVSEIAKAYEKQGVRYERPPPSLSSRPTAPGVVVDKERGRAMPVIPVRRPVQGPPAADPLVAAYIAGKKADRIRAEREYNAEAEGLNAAEVQAAAPGYFHYAAKGALNLAPAPLAFAGQLINRLRSVRK